MTRRRPGEQTLPVRVTISLDVDLTKYLTEYGYCTRAEVREHIVSAIRDAVFTEGIIARDPSMLRERGAR